MAVKVFVSSTYIDLKDHRQRVITQLRRAGYHVDPMEDWTSDANEPRQFSLDRLDGCQACVLLVGFRRGFVPPGQARSITQMEYDYAIARGIDVLPFLLDDGVIGWPDHYDDRTKDPLLKEWRESLGLRHGVERFTTDPTSVDVLPALSRWKDRQYAREQLEAAGFTPAGPTPVSRPHRRRPCSPARGDHSAIVRGHAPLRPGQPQPAGHDREGLGHLDHRRAPALAPAGHPARAGPDRTPRRGDPCLGPPRPAGPRRPGVGAGDPTG